MKISALVIVASSSFFGAFPTIAAEVATDDFYRYVTTSFPKIFCQSHLYFRQCFKISELECKEAILGGVEGCISGLKKRQELPSRLDDVQGANVSSWLGACAGIAFENIFKSSQIHSEYCNDLRKQHNK